MRILVLQLARFGDIYQSWPALRALQRTYPGCELHVLVRERFRAAADDLPGIKVHAMPTKRFHLLFSEEGASLDEAIEYAHSQVQEFFAPLIDIQFDRIINLSFSPLSSFITDWLAAPHTQIQGYTRHSDGHFHIPDDTSAYFHAQVGIQRANRYHITEIFAAVAGVDLADEDFAAEPEGARKGIVAHLAASSVEKSYPPELWIKALSELVKIYPVTLLGSKEERGLSEAICSQVAGLENKVGETTLNETMAQIRGARLLIGADSAPVHMAALSATRVLNLSCGKVNFYETGPMSAGSRVLFAEEIGQIAPMHIVAEAAAMLEGGKPSGPCFEKPSPMVPYEAHAIERDDFAWQLIQALYTGTPYPPLSLTADRLTFQRIFELAELALQQLARWENPETKLAAAKILAQVDSLLAEVAKLNPRIEPVIQWFETERLRIPPGTDAETLTRTIKCFQDLYLVASVYREASDDESTLRARAVKCCLECAPELREYNFNAVADSFQTLVSTLHDLARGSTKVANQSWSSVLEELNSALEARDYIGLADLLQWKLAVSLRCTNVADGRDILNP